MSKKRKVYAIGDIHGCYDQLTSMMYDLLSDGLDVEKDTVVFMGDYVDRGLDTAKVINWCANKDSLYDNWHFLYGNHEDLMLDALVYGGQRYGSYDLWWQQGGRETANSYFYEDMDKYERAISNPIEFIPPEHLDWLRKRPLYFETKDYFFVHAGIPRGFEIDTLKKELDKPYNQYHKDVLWVREEFIDNVKDWGKKIVFGHTPDSKHLGEPIIKKNKIGIDGAVCPPGSKNLLAIKLPDEKIFKIAAK